MASRMGKYKVSKKESAISLVDGGNVNGAFWLFINGFLDTNNLLKWFNN